MLHYSYLVWILIFMGAPLAILWFRFYKLLRRYGHVYLVNGLLVSLGLIWDNWGVARRVWSFPGSSNTGHVIIHLPLEEYVAFGLLFTFMVTSLTIVIFNYSQVPRR